MTDSIIIRDFVAKQRELLALELQAENDQEQELLQSNKGKNHHDTKQHQDEERTLHVLGQLEASDISVGLYGRTVVQLTLWSDIVTTTENKNQPDSSLRLLPAHRFTVGDEVEIRTKSTKGSSSSSTTTNDNSIGGVISAVSDTYISVALFQDKNSIKTTKKGNTKTDKKKDKSNNKTDDDDDDDDEQSSNILNQAPLTLVPKSSIEVHKKLMATLDRLEKYGIDHPIAGRVIQVMFQQESLSDNTKRPPPNPLCTEVFNVNLDESQKDAIAFALDPSRSVALIHGPPGTGKTTTVAELIRQAVHYHKMRVLVTAPSNVAVDNILERLVALDNSNRKGYQFSKNNNNNLPRLRTVRLGHPARIKSSILSHSLEALVQSSEGTEIVRDVRQELQSYLKILSNPKTRAIDKKLAYREVKTLRKEVRIREEKVVQELIHSANVVLATTVGADNRILNTITNPRDGGITGRLHGFDLVIIDEAAQALEASCWIPILRGRKVVLAGDHCQLPPTIKSKDQRAIQGLGNTMFERLMKLYSADESQISRMLKMQYRMNHNIADWASQAMYRGDLMSHPSVRDRILRQLPSVQQKNVAAQSLEDDDEQDRELRDTILLLIDTAGCDMYEQVTAAGSRFNEGEALVVDQHIRNLIDVGIDPSEIAVITPYNGQVELLRNMLLQDYPKLEIRSVDGFQGGEREAVILSLVRSSERGGMNGIGFLKDDRRQNVAVTRAKRHLAVVCDTETVSQSSFIRSLISWIEDHGEQRSAVEYTQTVCSTDYEEGLRKAEQDLAKLVGSSFANPKTQIAAKSKREPASTFDNNPEQIKRNALMDEISRFSESGASGEEIALSRELSSYDRRLVHEFAEQLGLHHESRGTEGVDRRIILTIRKQVTVSNEAQQVTMDEAPPPAISRDKEKGDHIVSQSPVSKFAALVLNDSDTEESDAVDGNEENQDESKKNVGGNELQSSDAPAANFLLAELAKERAARQVQKQGTTENGSSSSKPKQNKKKKSKGQKLGGNTQTKLQIGKEENLDDLDDMAFLDAQIEKAQNTHGRKVVGSGKGYRTIVNGILNSRPEPREKPTNTKANASLQAKLKEAENARKKKKKK